MTDPGRIIHRVSAVAAVLAAGMTLAACGDDEDTGSNGAGADSSSPAAQKITIKVTGAEKAPEVEVSGAPAKPGAATLELQNGLDKGSANGQLIYIEEEHSDEEVIEELQKAMQSKPVADWFHGGGGPGDTEAGETSSVTQELKEGTYLVVAGDEPQLPLARIEVSGEGGPAFEPPAATIEATEYAFSGKGVKSGQPVLLDNAGSEWHHFVAAKLKPGSTIEDVKQFFKTEKGEPPVEGEPGSELSSTVLEGGASQVIEFEGEPGKHVLFCFIADKQGGPPHVAKGMISEVVVE